MCVDGGGIRGGRPRVSSLPKSARFGVCGSAALRSMILTTMHGGEILVRSVSSVHKLSSPYSNSNTIIELFREMGENTQLVG